MIKLTYVIFLLRCLRLSLSANGNLNLSDSLVLLFSVFINIVSIFNDIDQIIDLVHYFEQYNECNNWLISFFNLLE